MAAAAARLQRAALSCLPRPRLAAPCVVAGRVVPVLPRQEARGASAARCKSSTAAASAGRDAAAKGSALEARLARLLRAAGARNVRSNLRLRDANGNLSEIDVRSGLLWHTYYECKAYGADHAVPLEDVAKFKEVLRLLRVPASRAVFVTTSTYSPRATTIGIRTVDGAQLAAWESAVYRAARRWRIARWFATAALVAAALLAAAPAYAASSLPGATSPLMHDALRWRASAVDAASRAADAVTAADLPSYLPASLRDLLRRYR